MKNKMVKCISFILIMVFCMSMTVCAEENVESVDIEQTSFSEYEGQQEGMVEPDQYVDGIYNVGANARASMIGVIRLYQSGSKLACAYSTSYTYTVDRIGTKNIKLQYKGSLGLWHNIITLDDRYTTNDTAHQGGFSCTGVVGRTYRVSGTHYVVNGSYTENRNNITEGLTFR